jgi:iron complex transport system ATP-binding protein
MGKEYSALEVKNLNFSINSRVILNNICLNIKSGKFCSIIGPNGSGKTTLLKNISTTYKPEVKKIYINGKDVAILKVKELGKHISYVKQGVDIEFDFIVRDIVLMGRIPHMKRLESERQSDIDIAEEAMKLTNILHLKDRNIRQLSGGEKQRVMIARAIAQEGNVLLLDEPTSHLYIYHQFEILDTVKKINKELNTTIVAVLHDLNLAAQYSDYIFIVNDGKLAAQGTPLEVLTEETLRNIYNVEIKILKNSDRGIPYIIPICKVDKPKGRYV